MVDVINLKTILLVGISHIASLARSQHPRQKQA